MSNVNPGTELYLTNRDNPDRPDHPAGGGERIRGVTEDADADADDDIAKDDIEDDDLEDDEEDEGTF